MTNILEMEGLAGSQTRPATICETSTCGAPKYRRLDSKCHGESELRASLIIRRKAGLQKQGRGGEEQPHCVGEPGKVSCSRVSPEIPGHRCRSSLTEGTMPLALENPPSGVVISGGWTACWYYGVLRVLGR